MQICLDRLLIDGQDTLVRPQALAFPEASVQVQHDTGFADKIGVAREEPVGVTPRLQHIFSQNPGQAPATEMP
jgi:hypothetical protein